MSIGKWDHLCKPRGCWKIWVSRSSSASSRQEVTYLMVPFSPSWGCDLDLQNCPGSENIWNSAPPAIQSQAWSSAFPELRLQMTVDSILPVKPLAFTCAVSTSTYHPEPSVMFSQINDLLPALSIHFHFPHNYRMLSQIQNMEKVSHRESIVQSFSKMFFSDFHHEFLRISVLPKRKRLSVKPDV